MTPSSPFRRPRLRRGLHPLPFLLAAHAALALGYLLVVPPWEAPDEPAHLRRIAELACRFGLAARDPGACRGEPILGDQGVLALAPDAGCPALAIPVVHDPSVWTRAHLLSSYEAYQPPLGHLAYVPLFLLAGPTHPVLFPDPRYPRSAPGVFLHELDDVPLFAATGVRLRVVRLTGIVFGLLTVAASWVAATLLAPGRRDVPIAAAAFTAFLPQFTFAAGTLGTDLPAAAAGAWLLVWILRGIRAEAPISASGATVAGALLLAAVGSRPNAIPLVAVGLLALLIRIGRRRGPRMLLGALAVGSGVLAAGAGLLRWALPAWWRTLAGQATVRLSGGGAFTRGEAAARIGRSFLGEFGWLDVRLPTGATIAAAVLAVALLLSLAVVLARGREWGIERLPILLAASGVVILAALAVLNATATGQAQGRYLFPLLAAISGLAGVAACAPFTPRAGMLIAWGLTALLLAGNVAALLGVVRPAYARPASGLLTALHTSAGPLALLHGRAAASGFEPGTNGEWLLASPAGAELALAIEFVRPVGVGTPSEATHPLPFTSCGEPAPGGIRLERARLQGRLAAGGTVTLRWHEPPLDAVESAAPRLRLGD